MFIPLPLELPFPENLRFFGRIGLSEGETAFSARLSQYRYKVIDKDKYPYNLLYSKNTKNKADIKNINNEVLGKGERERENRFYKIGFPLAVK